ncbi:MAG: DUF4416 family protein [Phycisphaerae bacterium]
MGTIRPPRRAKLFCGLLGSELDLLALGRRRLAEHFGEIDLQSQVWPFDATDYYEAETGPGIQRQFVFFDNLISVERLAEIKRLTNEIEHRICDDLGLPRSTRRVNIDPGYISLSKLVLATTKDHAHRIYLQQGIFAEVTLRFEKGGWRAWPWTYPDYASETYHAFFTQGRERLKQQLGAT